MIKAILVGAYSSDFHWAITTTWVCLAVIVLFFAALAVGAWSQFWISGNPHYELWSTELAFDVICSFLMMILIPMLAFHGQKIKNKHQDTTTSLPK
jgi:hypothetical protein